MASWNSTSLEIVYQVFGWTAFVSWSISFYPQCCGVELRFRGAQLDEAFVVLIYNAVLYFSSAVQRQYREKYGIGQHMLTILPGYLPSTWMLITSSWGVGLGNAIGFGSPWWWGWKRTNCLSVPFFHFFYKYVVIRFLLQMIPVAANDVAFSIHAVILTAFTLFQIAIYERGTQKVSKISIGIVSAAWLSAAVCVIIAFPNHSWLWLISVFK
ncbi:Cystinosin-like [Vitis vinifera]|uniref:Cystinosin-like n=1 Tax=Vitis vinifera TaxID=29760 RepID=A0A438G9V9_VITVI|nr:Cystinosin-like [Vitis vinifera]